MADSQISTTLELVDGITLVHVAGPLDSMTHETFKDFLEPLVTLPRARVVLDCAKLTYINSKGLALLGRFQRLSMQNLAFLGIAGMNARITKTIELLGLSRIVRLFPTLDEAMAAARSLA